PTLAGTWTPTAAARKRSAPGRLSSTVTTSPRSTRSWPRRATSAGGGPPSSWPRTPKAPASPRGGTRGTRPGSRPPPTRPHGPDGPASGRGGAPPLRVPGRAPAEGRPRRSVDGHAEVKLPAYDRGQKVATRKAYGEALAALGARPNVVAMDGEVSNSTYANLF